MISPFFAEKSKRTALNPYSDVKRMESGVVKIRAGIDEGEERKTWQTGTGFVIRKFPNRHYILTVTHVVKGADEILVEYRHLRHQTLRAKVLRMQGGAPNGLALLMVEQATPPGTSTIYMEETEQSKAEVIALGFPRKGRPWELTRGKVEKIEHSRIAFSAPVDSGNSGGPLLGTSGHAIGIITSTKSATGFATSTARIKKVLADWAVLLPNPPPLVGNGSYFPHDWALFLKSGYLQHMLATSDGFLAITHDNKILRYGLDLKLRDQVETKPGTSFNIQPLLSRDGRLLWNRIDDEPDDMYIASLEKNNTIREVKLHKKFFQYTRFLELANGRILVFDRETDGLGSLQFDPTTGKPDGPPRSIYRGRFYQVEQAIASADGGFYVLFSNGLSTEERYSIARQDSKGQLKTIDLDARRPSYFRGVTMSPDGDLLVSFESHDPEIRKSLILRYDSSLKLISETNIALAGANASVLRKLSVLRNGNYIAINWDELYEPRGAQFPKRREVQSLIYMQADGKILWRKMFPETMNLNSKIMMVKEIGPDKILIGGIHGSIEGKDGFIFAVNHKGEYMVPR